MAASKKKPRSRVKARDVAVGSSRLDSVLLDLAEQAKESAIRSAHAEALAADAQQRATVALETIAAIFQDSRAFAGRTQSRLQALEK